MYAHTTNYSFILPWCPSKVYIAFTALSGGDGRIDQGSLWVRE